MPRVPRPDELPRAALDPANEPPTINIGVASRIGQAGRDMGNAISSLGRIGEAFAQVGGKISDTQDAAALANAKLEWMKGDHEIQTDMSSTAGEDGSGWQAAPDRYKGLNENIGQKYQFNDERRRLQWDMWREQNTARRGFDAARNYQTGQRDTFVRGFDADLSGFTERLERGEVDPETFNQYQGALGEKLQGMNRRIMSETEVQAKSREMQARLMGSLDRYLATKDPAERERFWGQVRGGQYEIDQPSQPGRGAAVPGGLGSVSAKYESGGRGVGFISSGRNDPGGQSYGVHQLSGAYSMGAFLRSPEGAKYVGEFGGAKPMTPQFNQVYKRIAAADPQGFAEAQKAFYTRTHYEPVRQHAAKLGFNVNDRGVQEALFSASVQHAGAKTIVSRAAQAGAKTPQEQIQALYASRTRYVQGVRLPPDTKASVLNRYRNEINDALRLAGTSGEVVAEAAPAPAPDAAPARAEPLRVAEGPQVQSEVMSDASPTASDEPANDNANDPGGQSYDAEQPAGVDANDPAGTYEAGAVAAPTAQPGGIPMGRLLPGQTFTIKTPRGEIAVTSEMINALPPKAREQMSRGASEAYRLYERQLRATADDMIKNGEAAMAATGRPSVDYDPAAVRLAYQKDPKRFNDHARRMMIAGEIHAEFADAASVPDDELLAKIERLKPQEGSADFAARQAIWEQAEKRVIGMMKMREQDPGKAVEASREVQSVRSKLVGGVPRNKLDAIALMDARMNAQRNIDIPEHMRSPLTGDELRALAKPLRGLNTGDALESIQKLHDKVKATYGEKYSGLIIDRVIGTTIREKQRRETFGAMLKELDEESKVSPTTVERMRNLEELGRREREMAPTPQPKPASPGIIDRIRGMLPERGKGILGPSGDPEYEGGGIGQPEPAPAPVYPTPSSNAVNALKRNPLLADEFEKKFGPGSSDKAIPGLRRLLKLQQ